MGSVQPAIKRIAIVGAGPTGLAFAKFLKAEKAFDTIDIFEQRSRTGGIWNLTDTKASQHIPIPQINPQYGMAKSPRTGSDSVVGELELETPLYDYLETNIPKPLMAYHEKPFAADLPLFPGHADVLRYLEEYADDVRDRIKFRTKVLDVAVQSNPGIQDEWHVTTYDLDSDQTTHAVYDAIVVANGHYTVPHVPDVNGVQAWNAAYPDTIIHSKAYRKPEHFKERRVLVIGNSASGLDIAAQIAEYSKHPVFLSSRSASQLQSSKLPEWRKDIGEVIEFLPPGTYNRAVRTKSGMIVEDLDSVIFATGYYKAYPFLSNLRNPIITDGLRARDIYQHFLHIDYPSLALPVLNLKIIPFPLAENEAAVTARLWSGRLPMPSEAEMREWELNEIEAKGEGKDFHLMRFPGDVAQLNDLYAWAKTARPENKLDHHGEGKLGFYRNEEQVWMRSIFPDLKAAFAEYGQDRKKVRTVEELGFSFEKWKANATEEDLKMFEKAHVPSVSV